MQNESYVSKYLDNLSVYSRIWQQVLKLQVPVYVNQYMESGRNKLIISLDLPDLKNEAKYFKIEILGRMATLKIFAENVVIGKKRLLILINEENTMKFDKLVEDNIMFSKPGGRLRQD